MSSSVLDRPTLVLNRSWQPVNVAPVSRALALMWNESAFAIDPDTFQLYGWEDWARMAPREGEPFLRTVRSLMRVPEVVRLPHYDGRRQAIVAFCRRNLFKRDHSTCQYCGCRPGTSELTVDHVLPRSQGGVSSWENCVLACVSCNARKANRTPEQAGMHLRKPPHRPSWKPHYSMPAVRIESWSRFLSEAYWNVTLVD